MKKLVRAFGATIGVVALAMAGVAVAGPASAATLTEVTNFGANPSNLRMHLYVPDQVDPNPAIVVAIHFCTGSGPVFYNGTQYASLADQHGFIVIYPSATRSGNCFDVSSPQSLSRGGGSDPVSIMSMVNYVRQNYNADPDRIFATGISSGGMMTNVLLGNYPDVFAAGASFAGVAHSCFATTNGSMWNSQCANGQIIRTAQAWGDLARGAFPGYNGSYPRMQIWHGTADGTVDFANFTEQVKQWTNLHGLSQNPTVTDSPAANLTRTRYGSSGSMAPVEAIAMAGGPHNIPIDAAEVIRFFGLDIDEVPPPNTPPPTTPPPATGGCDVSYGVNAWNSGLVAQVTITNTGSSSINGWSLAFTLPSGQTIINGWNASYQPNSGSIVAGNAAYNANLNPGSSVSFGFQATHTGNAAEPSSFTLNGSACTVS